MTHIEETIKRVKSVLNSGLTPYRIAKEVGYAGANPVHDLISGKSDINRMQLGTALKFEKLYEELEKMKKVYIESTEETIYLDEELKGYGLGKYFANEIESVENRNDFGTGTLYTWLEPDLDNAMIYGEYQAVMTGRLFDLEGNLYQVTWKKVEDKEVEDMNGLDEFADWENPYSVVLI